MQPQTRSKLGGFLLWRYDEPDGKVACLKADGCSCLPFEEERARCMAVRTSKRPGCAPSAQEVSEDRLHVMLALICIVCATTAQSARGDVYICRIGLLASHLLFDVDGDDFGAASTGCHHLKAIVDGKVYLYLYLFTWHWMTRCNGECLGVCITRMSLAQRILRAGVPMSLP